jgi:predicted AlkP superfamily phosphohydrolase/phosphomutase
MKIFNKFKKKKRNRAVVFGLDGVPYTMLQDMLQKNLIPNMARIFNKGYFGRMEVCIPEISSVSWSSFMTGKQSGEHGIFGFIDLEKNTYQLTFPNHAQLKSPAIWEDLAKEGKQSVVINMPSTYPAKEINGVLVSGFVAVDMNKAVYPKTLISKLKEKEYRIDIDLIRARGDMTFLFKELDETLIAREKAAHFLWNDLDWDLFLLVVTGTDRLMHYLFDAYLDENHPWHASFLEYYRKVDAFVGRIYDRFMELDNKAGENTFYMLSDHGFTRIETEVYLNRWLSENGYLKYKPEKPETIMDIGPGSLAFAIDPSRIYINLKDKYPFGTVDSEDYERNRMELKDKLMQLTFDGSQQVVKQIYLKEELYHGPYLDMAPDLVLLSNHGFDLKGRVNTDQVFKRTDLVGMHTQDDAFFYNSRNIASQNIFELRDIILDGFA